MFHGDCAGTTDIHDPCILELKKTKTIPKRQQAFRSHPKGMQFSRLIDHGELLLVCRRVIDYFLQLQALKWIM